MAAIQPHNAKASAVWSSGGAAYDEVSRQIAAAIAHCVYRLDPQPGERVLDQATGTGWTSREVARLGADVTGTDIAEDLLAAARQRAGESGLRISYQTGDAEALPFADASFDRVISTFGVMFASRPDLVASELARVVKPGGRIALATWAPDGNVFEMFKVMRAYMPPPPDPAPPSPFAWGGQARVEELLGADFELGFEEGTVTYHARSAEQAWDAFVTGYGPTRALAGSLDAERRAGLRHDFVAFHERFATPLGVAVPRTYLVTVGTKR